MISQRTEWLAALAALLCVSGSAWAQPAAGGDAGHGTGHPTEHRTEHRTGHATEHQTEHRTEHPTHSGGTPAARELASPPFEAVPTAADPPSAAAPPAIPAAPPTDHGDMQMQGGSPAPDARDPHAYSDGHVRGAGQYALASGVRLRLGDEHRYRALIVNRLERVDGDDGMATAYEAQAWFGTTYDRLVVKAEGERARGELEHARTELLWGHALSAYFDTQLGVRHDSGVGPDRQWLAVGIQGLAPYWFELDATAYVGSGGRTALRLEAEYELLLTQRLILQPAVELNAYGRSDRERAIGSGVSDVRAGLRLRYEITRQIAPYLGVEWTRKYGETQDLARQAGERADDTRVLAGVRFWF